MATTPILSSPQYLVWELFQALRRLCERVGESHIAQNESVSRQDAALCTILAVQCVEVFFNVYFKVLINEPDYAHANEKISNDLDNTMYSLEKKIKEWPRHAFGKGLDLGGGAGQKFIALKERRNRLIHFTSSHVTFSMPGFAIYGMADTTDYHSLTAKSAIDALQTAEAFLCEIFMLRGISPENLSSALHSWTGKPLIRKQSTAS
ncbi:MAG TPA: hypothetical protein PKD88_11915 [Nitrosomonas sp.]|nr:hypothetical protein [Nitrosomonas sp.]HMW21695.1 hypothetical protein [Nitrosomonas sp.]HMW69878.1 hypothetical protein [Nitrosomonas sp.]HMY61862.1 hypothetical protein [Nitrosomonas sp.]HMY90055.1 hypothetical protein [Nitrosomonas sp.]